MATTELKEKYESFIAHNELNEGNVHNLLRLCGYAPLESQRLRVPQSLEELEKLCLSVEKRYSPEDLLSELRLLFGGDFCTRDELRSVLQSGDRLTDEEYAAFCEQLPCENGLVSLEGLVELLTRK